MRGLATEDGVAVGDAGDTIPDRFGIGRFDWDGERFPSGSSIEMAIVVSANPDATGANLERGVRAGAYLVIDGVVAAYGNGAIGCD